MSDPTLSLAEAVRELRRRVRDAEALARDNERHRDARRQALWETIAGELASFEQVLARVEPAVPVSKLVAMAKDAGDREDVIFPEELRALIAEAPDGQ